MLRLLLYFTLFAVVKHCPRLCGRGRDYGVVGEWELAHFLRGLMRFIYPVTSIPAEYEITALLQVIDSDCVDVDAHLYKKHFGQYFRYDISSQLSFFYKAVQKMLVGLCRGLSGLWQRTWLKHLSLTPFDPVLIHQGSDDRRVDSLVETCAVLTAHGLVDLDDGGVVQQQYREVTQFFKKRWSFCVDELPAVDDVIAMWLSYPHWSRCAQLRQVVNLVLSVVVVSSYQAEFVDDAATALDPNELASSLHLVRSWFGHSFVGKSRRDLRGLMRIAETTDMQVSRLSDSVRAKPWDQLLKVGLDQSLSFCVALLDKGPEAPVVPIVDEYRSSILAQLNVMEVMAASPIRVSPKLTALPSESGSKSKRPRSQSDVKLKTPNKDANVVASTTSKSAIPSKTRGAIRRSGGRKTPSSTGRRTGGKPQSGKKLVLSLVASESADQEDQLTDDGLVKTSRRGKRTMRIESSDES